MSAARIRTLVFLLVIIKIFLRYWTLNVGYSLVGVLKQVLVLHRIWFVGDLAVIELFLLNLFPVVSLHLLADKKSVALDPFHRNAKIWLHYKYLRQQITGRAVDSFALVLYVTLQNSLLDQYWIIFFLERQTPKFVKSNIQLTPIATLQLRFQNSTSQPSRNSPDLLWPRAQYSLKSRS